MSQEVDQLSLEQIQQYLQDLGYDGVPEDTLLQLRDELAARMSRVQDSEAGSRVGEAAGSGAGASGAGEGFRGEPEGASQGGDSLRRRQRQRHGDAPRPPAAEPRGRGAYDYADVERELDADFDADLDADLDADFRRGQRGARPGRGAQRPASARDAGRASQRDASRDAADQRISELYGRSPDRAERSGRAQRPATAGSAGGAGRSGRFTTYGQTYDPYEFASRGANPSYRHCMSYTPGKSRYTLAEKKARGSDPVSYYAKMEARWAKQGAPEDGKKWREYQERQRRIRAQTLGEPYY